MFKRGDVAWTYRITTGEVRPVIVLDAVESEEENYHDKYTVLWGVDKQVRYGLCCNAEQAQANLDCYR